MKSLSQIVLAIGAVVVLVAGVTFVSQYQVGVVEEDKAPTPKSEATAPTAEVKLNFLRGTVWEWKPPSAGQFEQQTSGWHDFWFQNENTVPARLGLKAKSCKCSEVLVGLLPADDVKRYRHEAAADGAEPPIQPNLQPLEVDDAKGITVEPGEGGVVRLAWEDKKEKSREERAERLVVQVWTQGLQGGPKTINGLELPVTYVPALRLTDALVSLDDLNPNEEKTKEVRCWSSTRTQFPLTAKEQSGDPCIQCTCIPLSDQAREELGKSTNSRVLCGYTVRVTARERLDDKVQMELGPFSRRIMLTSNPDIDPTGFLVSGVVKGDVTIGSEDDKGRITLGFFPAKYGVSKRVWLTAHRPDLELKVDKVEPEELTHLKVKSLKKAPVPQLEGRTRWELWVEVPPGSPSGSLPTHSAILLTIPGNPPRHIRIPVVGNATQ